MARVVLALLAAALLVPGQIPKAEIEHRLRSFEDTNFKRELKLQSMFEEAGCTGDNLTEQRVKHAQAPNVICKLPGSTDSQIIVGAHFDFVDRGKGVVDNWSGCSLLPSLFQSLKETPRHHTFIFIGFTNEEEGLVGSKFYVHQLSKEARSNIAAMVNLDSLGVSPTKMELDRADKKLTQALATVAGSIKLPLSVMNVHRVGRSDSDSFQDSKIPAICIHSVTTETFPILHTSRDQFSAIHLDDYYNSYLLLRAYLAYLDEL
ncbi:MAG TPA: M28 family peptidase [Bryobacteraceae bacterium]|nr:M28 family peptidase [Bryobacteraceae bacterium]